MNNHNLFYEIGGVYEIFPYVDVMFANIMKTGWLWIHEYHIIELQVNKWGWSDLCSYERYLNSS